MNPTITPIPLGPTVMPLDIHTPAAIYGGMVAVFDPVQFYLANTPAIAIMAAVFLLGLFHFLQILIAARRVR